MTGRAFSSHPNRGRRRTAVVCVASSLMLALGLSGPGPVASAEPLVAAVVAPPNGTAAGFAPRALAVPAGASLDLVGADTTAHNLACAKKSKKRRGKPRRPLCQSAFAASGQTARVEGVEVLAPGTYALFCQLHPQMTLELTVI